MTLLKVQAVRKAGVEQPMPTLNQFSLYSQGRDGLLYDPDTGVSRSVEIQRSTR